MMPRTNDRTDVPPGEIHRRSGDFLIEGILSRFEMARAYHDCQTYYCRRCLAILQPLTFMEMVTLALPTILDKSGTDPLSKLVAKPTRFGLEKRTKTSSERHLPSWPKIERWPMPKQPWNRCQDCQDVIVTKTGIEQSRPLVDFELRHWQVVTSLGFVR